MTMPPTFAVVCDYGSQKARDPRTGILVCEHCDTPCHLGCDRCAVYRDGLNRRLNRAR